MKKEREKGKERGKKKGKQQEKGKVEKEGIRGKGKERKEKR